MEYKMSVISTSVYGTERVSDLLIVCGVSGFEVCSSADFEEFLSTHIPAYDYVDEEVMKLAPRRCVIKFYTEPTDEGDRLIRDVESALSELKSQDTAGKLGTLELTVSVVDDGDWKDNWKKYYRPITISDKLLVVPAWENAETKLPVLKIEPGMAFGTGSHETTALCLEMLANEQLAGKSVMDVGCGSGILSQAAVILGAERAEGCDIDEAAVSTARANAKLNGLEDRATYYCGDLISNVSGKYDVAVANIVADVIILLSSQIGIILEHGGAFIASGIISERADEVAQNIARSGFQITEIKERRGWVAIRSVYK